MNIYICQKLYVQEMSKHCVIQNLNLSTYHRSWVSALDPGSKTVGTRSSVLGREFGVNSVITDFPQRFL